MSIDELANLIEALTKLVGALIWPGLAAFVLIRFGPSLRDFFQSLGEFTLKGPGFEATAKRKQTEVAAALAAAAGSRSEATPETAAREARAAAEIVYEAVTPKLLRQARASQVLWVDDNPDNNINERHALETLGISIVISTSTDDALEKVRTKSFDAIVSDMGRPPDPKAGYTLLEKLRALGNQTPFIIYAGSRTPEHQAEARQRGAIGCTNRANELFEMVLSTLGRESQWRTYQ
jgi:CheY-like chemotaxis protein